MLVQYDKPRQVRPDHVCSVRLVSGQKLGVIFTDEAQYICSIPDHFCPAGVVGLAGQQPVQLPARVVVNYPIGSILVYYRDLQVGGDYAC
jgi:hypothetical protein